MGRRSAFGKLFGCDPDHRLHPAHRLFGQMALDLMAAFEAANRRDFRFAELARHLGFPVAPRLERTA